MLLTYTVQLKYKSYMNFVVGTLKSYFLYLFYFIPNFHNRMYVVDEYSLF